MSARYRDSIVVHFEKHTRIAMHHGEILLQNARAVA
jgi:hypothetical protein